MINVYIESGKRRSFACAVDWPGWCRSGGDESAALQALFDYGPRYARLLQTAGIDFQPPDSVSEFTVVEWLKGSLTTDFGAPDKLAASDANPMDEAELLRFQTLLWAYWRAFSAASQGRQTGSSWAAQASAAATKIVLCGSDANCLEPVVEVQNTARRRWTKNACGRRPCKRWPRCTARCCITRLGGILERFHFASGRRAVHAPPVCTLDHVGGRGPALENRNPDL
jgi:hypothetical protein